MDSRLVEVRLIEKRFHMCFVDMYIFDIVQDMKSFDFLGNDSRALYIK